MLGALALQAEEDATCSGCGQPLAESMHPMSEAAYAAHLVVCHACAEMDRYKDRLAATERVEPGGRIRITKEK